MRTLWDAASCAVPLFLLSHSLALLRILSAGSTSPTTPAWSPVMLLSVVPMPLEGTPSPASQAPWPCAPRAVPRPRSSGTVSAWHKERMHCMCKDYHCSIAMVVCLVIPIISMHHTRSWAGIIQDTCVPQLTATEACNIQSLIAAMNTPSNVQ
jgi:hypothetical protein